MTGLVWFAKGHTGNVVRIELHGVGLEKGVGGILVLGVGLRVNRFLVVQAVSAAVKSHERYSHLSPKIAMQLKLDNPKIPPFG